MAISRWRSVGSIEGPQRATVKDLQEDVGNARIWGGIHYRFSVDDGITIGMKTADQVLAHHFHAVDDEP